MENEPYAVEFSCYIHRNPLRAGMIKRLMDYRWSTYPAYAYGRKAPKWVKMDMILSLFSGPDPRKAYREKVQGYAEEEKDLWEDFRHGLLMGTAEFVERIKSRYVSAKPHREVPQQKGIMGRIDAEQYLIRASTLLGHDLNRFREMGRLYGEEREDRDLLMYFIWQRGGFTNDEVGGLFGVSYSAVSHIVKRVKSRLRGNKTWQKKLESVNSQIKI